MAISFDDTIQLPRIGDQALPFDPAIHRQYAYSIEQQLNCLFDDVEAGLFGNAARTGKFFQYVQSIKEQFPKPPTV